MERRFIDVQLAELRLVEPKTDGGMPLIRGYAAVFNSPSVLLYGAFREVIEPGFFTDVLDNDVRALWNHDDSRPLGRTKSGTLRIWEDNTGLGYEFEPPNSPMGHDSVASIKRGDVNQSSFAFAVLPGGETWTMEEDGTILRHLQKAAAIYDVSPVTYPAYPATNVGIRGITAYGDMPEIPNEFKRALKKTDDLHADLVRARGRQRQLQLVG